MLDSTSCARCGVPDMECLEMIAVAESPTGLRPAIFEVEPGEFSFLIWRPRDGEPFDPDDKIAESADIDDLPSELRKVCQRCFDVLASE